MKTKTLTGKDITEIFEECCLTDGILNMSWSEVLQSRIYDYMEETWERVFKEYDASVYDYCFQFHKTYSIY